MHYLEAELRGQIATNPEMWEFIREGSLDGCWYWDLENRGEEWMSPEFWRLFGIDPATRAHRPEEWFDLIFEEDLARALDNLERHLADPGCPYDQIVRYRHVDGSTVWVRCRGVAVRDDTGRPIRMLGAHNDLTAVKRADEQALLGRQAERAASEELRAFAYSVSHDLKSPANSLYLLLGELEHAEADRLGDDGRALLGMCRGTVDRMRTLIEDLLQYTRLIEVRGERVPVDLNEVLGECCRDLEPLIDRTGAEVRADPLPVVQGAPASLKVMFANLVENAVKYTRPGVPPQVHIRQQAADDGRVRIEVADNGIGIDASHHERIFQMFKRLHTADEIPGSGLGLTLCRRIALDHGTDLSVTSESGAGAVFTATFERNGAGA